MSLPDGWDWYGDPQRLAEGGNGGHSRFRLMWIKVCISGGRYIHSAYSHPWRHLIFFILLLHWPYCIPLFLWSPAISPKNVQNVLVWYGCLKMYYKLRGLNNGNLFIVMKDRSLRPRTWQGWIFWVLSFWLIQKCLFCVVVFSLWMGVLLIFISIKTPVISD